MTSRFVALFIAFSVLPPQQQWTSIGAANILTVHTIHGKSHWNVMRGVLRALTDRGHTVTVFTPFVDGDRPGYTELYVSGELEDRAESVACYGMPVHSNDDGSHRETCQHRIRSPANARNLRRPPVTVIRPGGS
ncbi:unnamed protein product [Macrosiphum euphorbiae]|uniref:Uncharacterized protein n=1 Tax=Macrosiphum euphorbiae TaxID=13131 RepID=A0AAV0VVQ8_9HEMI|nr:unnamed protein product [Macrosiphum euphorbiae]